jgi:asparagine synthase (glutamine-hydrolysing)
VLRYEGVENPDYGYARLLAERQGIELIAPAVSDELLTQHVDALVCALDRPYDSVRELGLFEMYRSLRARELPVALVGEGADEFNLGYYHVLPGFAKGGDRCATAAGFREVLYERSRDVARYFSAAFIDEGLVSSVIEHNVREYYDRADIPDPLYRMEYYYIRKFLKGRLDMHDRLAMANSIETRVPYCDDDVVMASLAVPPELNLSGGTEKAILRKAFADILPESIAHRRKYALSESTDTVLYRTILRSFDAELAKADDAIWDILDKRYAVELRTIAEERISAAERDTLHDHELTAGTPLGEPLAFRIRHLFVLLTFLRWYDLYFVGT